MSIESRSNQYGTVFEHWQIKEPLGSGSGGRSMVFRLYREDSPWETSALRVISLIEERGRFDTLPQFRQEEYRAALEECRKKAAQEVRLMADLRGHTHILDYLDHKFVNWSDGSGYGCDMLIRMEQLQDLRSLIRQGETFREEEIVKIGRDICQALILCHRKKILHRDIKPENIFRSYDGDYKLGDFGISRILDAAPTARASTGIGTPEYAAPEQGSGDYDTRVDIYSLGLVLYELSNGNRLPFASSSYIRPEKVSKELGEIIGKACAFRPEDRFQSAAEFLQALNGIGVKPGAGGSYDTVAAGGQNSGGSYETVPAEQFGPGGQNTEQFYGSKKRKKLKAVLWIVLMLAIACLVAEVLWVGNALKEQDAEAPTVISEPEDTAPAVTDTEVPAQMPTEAPTQAPTELPTQPPTEAPTEPPTEPVTTESIMRKAVIAAGRRHTVVMMSDGTAVAAGNNENGQCDVLYWSDLVAIAAGDHHTVGLRSNGTVLATGQNAYGQCDVSGWSNVKFISAGDYHTVALCQDGSLLATGWNTYGQCNVSTIYNAVGGREIIAVAAGYEHTVVLCSDGTVAAVGRNDFGQCDVSGWTNVIAIYAGTEHTVGLRSDGTVVATGRNKEGQCNVTGWTDVAYLTAGDYFVTAVTNDGRVLSTGQNNNGQCNVSGWTNVIAVGGGSEHCVAIMGDGTILATGWNDDGQCGITQFYYH